MATFPPPVVPVFPAGYAPYAADFDQWYDTAGFFQNRVVFRGRQTVSATTLPDTGAVTLITIDTVDEDPYNGWSTLAHEWTPPAGYSGWYEVTGTLATVALAAGDEIRPLLGGTYTLDLATALGATSVAAGAEGWAAVYLVGGQDFVSLAGALYNASANVNTSIAAGSQSSLEIIWLST